MSGEAYRWARRQRGLSGPQTAVLTLLGDFFNEDWGRAWPSLARLAEESGFGRSTVERSMRSLVESGLVEAESWVLNEGAQRMPNRLLLPRYRSDVAAASVQPVLAMPFEGDAVRAGLRAVPGSKLCIEADALI